MGLERWGRRGTVQDGLRKHTGDGDTAETVLVLDRPNVSDRVGRLEAHGVGDESVLEPVDFDTKSASAAST